MNYENFAWLLPAWLLGFPLFLALIEKIRTPKPHAYGADARETASYLTTAQS